MNTTTRHEAAHLSALRRAEPPPWVSVLGRLLFVALFVTIAASLLLPWQQTATGSGRVTAFDPAEREQWVEAPVDGRVLAWHVREGQAVNAGDALATLRDNDPDMLDRLYGERVALETQLAEAERGVVSYDTKLLGTFQARGLAVEAADAKVRAQEEKVTQAEVSLSVERDQHETARLQLERVRPLTEQGLRSTRDLELAQLDFDRTRNNVTRAEAALRVAQRELETAQFDGDRTRREAEATVASNEAEVAQARSKVAEIREKLLRLENRIARQQTQEITAPTAGTVARILAGQGGEQFKAGDRLLLLIPATSQRAVELWIDGNDAPLVHPGDDVRLQFEGWPALQFAGWPGVAVGTFGGEVAFVDAIDDGAGRFRVVVVPDPEEEPWPDGRWLRQGVRAKGWVLLAEVSIAYELWRQLNDFPPTVAEPKGDAGKGKGDSKSDGKSPLLDALKKAK